MNLLTLFVELILNLDKHLGTIIQTFGNWTYAFLFLIILLETGLVIAPFLPGDSLIFAAGAFAAIGSLNILTLFTILCVAAILGDSLNYLIGSYFGPKVFTEKHKLLKKEYLDRTHFFFEKYGAKTIILARFVPIIRTVAPFVAGIGRMSYLRFLIYNIIGGILWVSLFVFGGYFFGNLPFVKDHFGLVILAIILVSIVPMAIEYYRYNKEKKK